MGAAHKYFAAHCFNSAWGLIDRKTHTEEEIETMIDLAHASGMHWRHREDETLRTRSIGAWQVSRVYSVAGRPDEALRYGTDALDIARVGDLDDFYVGYGHEAVARSATMLGDTETARLHLEAARGLLDALDDADSREALAADLDSIDG